MITCHFILPSLSGAARRPPCGSSRRRGRGSSCSRCRPPLCWPCSSVECGRRERCTPAVRVRSNFDDLENRLPKSQFLIYTCDARRSGVQLLRSLRSMLALLLRKYSMICEGFLNHEGLQSDFVSSSHNFFVNKICLYTQYGESGTP